MQQKSLKKNAFYSFLKSFLSLVFPIITFPYASRILLPEGIGKVNFANSVISWFVILAGLGITGYAGREASRKRNDEYAIAKLTKEIFIINGISTIVAYSLFILSFLFVPKFVSYRSLLLVCSIKIFFTTFGVDWIYNAFEEFRYKTIRSFVFQVLALVFLFLFVHSEKNVIAYAIFGLISNVGSNIFNLIHSRKFINFKLKTTIELKQHVKPIFIFWGISLVTSIYSILDTSMLGFFSTNEQVGYYSAATKINHMVLSMLGAIGIVLLPRLSYLIEKGEMGTFESLARKSLCVIMLLAFPMAAGLFLLSDKIVILLSGEQYAQAIIPMKIITPIIVFISIGNILGSQILPVLKKEKIALCSYIFGATCNIILNSILIPQYGALGAAIGTLVAEFSVVIFQAISLNVLVLEKEIFINFMQVLICTAIMVIGVSVLLVFLKSNLLFQILCSSFFGACIYGVSLFLIRNKYFIEYMGKVLKKTKLCKWEEKMHG